MKKILFIIMITVMNMTGAFAKADVKLIKGSLLPLKGSNAKVIVQWDYSNSTIEGKEPKAFLKEKGEEWKHDYQAEIIRAEENFIERINEKTKDIFAIKENTGAVYKIIIKVKDFNYGSTGVSVIIGFGAGDAHLSGTMEIYKIETATPVAIIDIDGVPGAGFGNEKRRVETYRELAEQLVKLIKKAK